MRSSTVFAISAVVMLVIGLTMASITNAPRLTIPGKHGWIMFPAEIQYYLLAAVFCVIAFIEANFTIPLSSTMIKWHCWLSICSTLLLLVAMGLFSLSLRRVIDLHNMQSAILIPLVVGVPVFVIAQVWFCGDLVRAFFRMST